MNTQQIN